MKDGWEMTHSVLVVDDVADLRLLLKHLLNGSAAFSVIGEAENGSAAIELAGRLRPDLILLDLAMPSMDGLAAMPLLKEAAPNAKVVVFTGFSKADVTAHQLDLADAYVEKGTHPEELLRVLDEVVAS